MYLLSVYIQAEEEGRGLDPNGAVFPPPLQEKWQMITEATR